MKLEIKNEEEYTSLYEIISDAMNYYSQIIEIAYGNAWLDAKKNEELYEFADSWLQRLEKLKEDSE